MIFFDKKYPNITEIISVKKTLYAAIPYFGHLSVKKKIEMSKLISEYFPHLDPQLILVINSKLNSFFLIQRLSPPCPVLWCCL